MTTATVAARNHAALAGVELAGPAGRLEGLLNEGAANAPYAALVCHPHPLGGGTMHNKVVYHAMKVLNAPEWGFQFPVLRFNFRGTGLSHGQHDGEAEWMDAAAAMDWLWNRYQRPLIVAGFSFGAAMASRACCEPRNASPQPRALIALGLPTHAEGRNYQYPFLATSLLPKLFMSGNRDQYAPADELSRTVAEAAEPKRLVLIPGADHFFNGHLQAMQQTLAAWLKDQLQ